jgi:outer membrane receptor protein involved in Fe transport
VVHPRPPHRNHRRHCPTAGGPFGLYAYARNLADVQYFTWALPLGPRAGYLTTPGDPRTFGVIAAAHF